MPPWWTAVPICKRIRFKMQFGAGALFFDIAEVSGRLRIRCCGGQPYVCTTAVRRKPESHSGR
eukprot:1355646-Lingulodinium_polyedra.AAC.1